MNIIRRQINIMILRYLFQKSLKLVTKHMAIDVLNSHLKNFYEVKIAYKTVVNLMKELHIVCKVRKKRYRYISQISNKITPNLLKRDFKKDEPNIAWVTDVSEFRFNGNVYIYL